MERFELTRIIKVGTAENLEYILELNLAGKVMSTLFVFARCGTWSIGKLQVFSEWFVKSLNWRCRKHLPVLYGHPSCDFRWTRSYRISFFVLVGRADLLPILPITLSLLEWFMNIKIWHKGKRNPLDERTPVETFMVWVVDHEHSGSKFNQNVSECNFTKQN